MKWEPIPGAPRYQANAGGQIRGPSGKILSTRLKRKYLQVEVEGKTRAVHRIIAELFVPNPELKPEVSHKDGNRHNNSSSNLVRMTRLENREHSYAMGLHRPQRGEDHGSAKVDDQDVRDIRKMCRQGAKYQEVAEIYELTRTAVGLIVRRETWGHVL